MLLLVLAIASQSSYISTHVYRYPLQVAATSLRSPLMTSSSRLQPTSTSILKFEFTPHLLALATTSIAALSILDFVSHTARSENTSRRVHSTSTLHTSVPIRHPSPPSPLSPSSSSSISFHSTPMPGQHSHLRTDTRTPCLGLSTPNGGCRARGRCSTRALPGVCPVHNC